MEERKKNNKHKTYFFIIYIILLIFNILVNMKFFKNARQTGMNNSILLQYFISRKLFRP